MVKSIATAAALLGIDPYSVRRLCGQHGIGQQLGGAGSPWVLTDEEIERLRGVARPGFGRPPAKKRRKSKAAKR